ncbi:MAG: DNA polymerase III subunit alpha [Desulfofustis sp.]|nr:DNA polymerase III subunit alpha [Desulfofustis sp.]
MVPLRVRSCFSLLRGTASPGSLCGRAAGFGYTRLALTDLENLYGLWSFLAACERHRIRPIIGTEIETGAADRLVLLVRNEVGYRNLCNIISRRKRKDKLDVSAETASLYEGLVLLSRSETMLRTSRACGLEAAADLGSRPTENGNRLRHLAATLGIPAVAVPDSDLGAPGEHRTQLLLRAIGAGETLDSGRQVRDQGQPLESPEVYASRFSIWPETLQATEEIADRCTYRRPAAGLQMPPWQQHGCQSAGVVLRQEAYEGARERYGFTLPDQVVERLDYELGVIESMGFSSYFLVVRDIVQPLQPDGTRKRRRICGRGSGAASLVAYCLSITNVCPIRYNLYFERFLNPGRSDPPDIDIDFAWDERDQVLAEVLGLFGERAAMVCNHVCFKPRGAIRETAKAYGLPGYEISRMTKRLPWFFKRSDLSLQEQIATLPSLKDQDFSGPWAEIIDRASELIGLPRYLSVHPGGVVITEGPVHDYVPVEQAPKGVPIIQWEKDGTEESGLVKIDLLGNRSLGVIRDAIGNLRKNGADFSEQGWTPEDDLQTKAAVGAGKTMGCFYIESPAMRLLQQKAGSGDFEQLVIQSSIIRPAANEFVREYVRRLHGGGWDPLHPALEAVLDETFGLMVYQEDVSKVAVALAGFSHSEADGLRKVLSKKDREFRLRDYRDKFYRGCRKNNIESAEIDRIWAMMMSFDGYSFCKPHSASYARVSFQSAYLKTHFPAEFMAAVISNQGGYYSTFSYVSEAKRMGLIIDPPDVRTSELSWRGQGTRIRVGLQTLHGLSQETCERILGCRKERHFRSFSDFLQRVQPAEHEIRVLVDSGAVDGLDTKANRSRLYWEAAAREVGASAAGGAGLFPVVEFDAPPLRDQSPIERLRREYQALGFLCRAHPVSLIGKGKVHTCKGVDLAAHVGRTVDFIGLLLTGKIVSTKTGEAMEFLTFEDETAIIETTFFPEVYRRYAHILSAQKVYRLRGLVEQDFGALPLTVEKIRLLSN